MILLEALLLVIGLVISLVTLMTKKLENNNKVKKILATFYISACVASVFLLFSKSMNNGDYSLKLFQELSKIGDAVELQTDSIQSILIRTANLYCRLDSINRNTKFIIEQRERNQKIFEEQNKILVKSNELTNKKLFGERPEIAIPGTEITFRSVDSMNSECLIKCYNIGKRSAINLTDKIIFVYKDKNGIYYKHGLTEDDGVIKSDNSLPYESVRTSRIGVKMGFEQIKSLTSGGSIIICLSYFDEITDEQISKEIRFEFTNDLSGENIIRNGTANQEKGLDEYLKKKNLFTLGHSDKRKR